MTGEITFDNIRSADREFVLKKTRVFYYIMQRFELERLTLTLGAISASGIMIQYALQYMSETKHLEKNINKFPAVCAIKMAPTHAEVRKCKTLRI